MLRIVDIWLITAILLCCSLKVELDVCEKTLMGPVYCGGICFGKVKNNIVKTTLYRKNQDPSNLVNNR